WGSRSGRWAAVTGGPSTVTGNGAQLSGRPAALGPKRTWPKALGPRHLPDAPTMTRSAQLIAAADALVRARGPCPATCDGRHVVAPALGRGRWREGALARRRPLGAEVDGIERLARGHEQPVALGSSKADIAAHLGQADAADQFAFGCPHG